MRCWADTAWCNAWVTRGLTVFRDIGIWLFNLDVLLGVCVVTVYCCF